MKTRLRLLIAVGLIFASLAVVPGGALSPTLASAAGCQEGTTTATQADQQVQCVRDYKESCNQDYDDSFCAGLNISQINQCAANTANPGFRDGCMKQLQNDYLLGSTSTSSGSCANKGISILPTWYKYIDGTIDETGHCTLNFTFPDDIGAVLLALIEILLRIAAIVSVFYVIYGGFLYMTSQGEPDRATAARTTIINAVIGLVIAIIATGVVSFIGGQLIK